MSIIAGSVNFTSSEALLTNPFGSSFEHYKYDYRKNWADNAAFFSYWHQTVSPESKREMQPLIYGDLVLVADLRLDNRNDLIDILPDVDSSLPDGVLVMKSYLKWGEECVEHLIGGFAFAIWDKRRKTLFCARDHVGQKSLFFYEGKGNFQYQFIFCTSPVGILNHPNVSKDIDPKGVFDILMGRLCNEETGTLFEGISRLAAGFCLKTDGKTQRTWRYWKPERGTTIRFSNDRDYVERYRELLEQSIKACVNTDRPVSSFLSGGLDSSSVSCVAHDLLKKSDRKLITTSFILPDNEEGVDERAFIDSILREKDFEHFYINRESVGFRECLQGVFETYKGFPFTSHSYYHKLLPRLAEKNVAVHLCGFGGDQVASYHSRWVIEELILSGRWTAVWKVLKSIDNEKNCAPFRLLLRSLQKIMQTARPNNLSNEWYEKRTDRRMVLPTLANSLGNRERVLHKPSLHSLPALRTVADDMYQAMQYQGTSVVIETIANKFLPYGIEYRTPLTDIRLIEYCMSVPAEQHYVGRKRSLIRRATEGIVPDNIRLAHNKHQGSTPNLFNALWDEKEHLTQELKNCSSINEVSSLIDISRLRKCLDSEIVIKSEKAKIYRNVELALYLTWFHNHFKSSVNPK